MSLKEKAIEALKSGPLTIHDLSRRIYGRHTEAGLASARMVLVRLRKEGIPIVTNKEITYELKSADLNTK